jgi:hypothetical protein
MMPTKPLPDSPWDQKRWKHTGLRRRILEGEWEQDIRFAVQEQAGQQRAKAWKKVDMSSNVLASVCGQLAVIYSRRPVVSHAEDEAAAKAVGDLLEGWESMMQRLQRNTIGLREMLLRPDVVVVDDEPVVVLRPVTPDMVLADVDSDRPEVPVRIRELRWRTAKDTGEGGWYWDELDVRDPGSPTYVIRRDTDQADVTAAFAGGSMSGESYPYRDSANRPYLPYVVYHADRTGQIFDPYHGREVVEGTLTASVYYSYLGHTLLRAAFAQRYIVGGDVRGSKRDDGLHVVEADPSNVLLMETAENFEGTPVVGQWGAGVSVQELEEAVSKYERRVAAFAKISASDIQRMSGDPRSGYALMISNEAKREASREYEPVFRLADRQLLAMVATMVNRKTGSRLPESGYDLTYQALPLSAEERKALREELDWLLERSFITEDEAQERLHAAGLVKHPRPNEGGNRED